MNTDTPETDQWEAYCDECYYHMWRLRRKTERGWHDGFHIHTGVEAKGLCDLLNNLERELAESNKLKRKLAEAREQRDEARKDSIFWQSLADPRFARFGESMWKHITKQGSDFCWSEDSEDILPLAQAAGLCCRVEYDPAIHGEIIEADLGDEIWWWGDFDWMNNQPTEP